MDKNKDTGMIDQFNRVFAIDNMYICDGSLISSNPGVNPLSGICAILEKTWHHIPPKKK